MQAYVTNEVLQPTEVLPPEPPKPEPVSLSLPALEMPGETGLDYLESTTVEISQAQRVRADLLAGRARAKPPSHAEAPAGHAGHRAEDVPDNRAADRPESRAEGRFESRAEGRFESRLSSGRPAAFTPADATEESLLAAAEAGNTDTFLSTLLLAKVLLPGATDVAELLADPASWRVEEIDGSSYAVVFTSKERLAEHAGGPIEAAWVKFTQLIREWPDEALAFAVNPGTPVGATLPGAQILALAVWADEVGLNSEDEEPEPVVTPEPADSGYRSFVTEQAERPVVMQKAISADQLAYYLQRGYDRVSGFVHRVAEVAHLRSPEELYAALGLSYSGSPFKPDDDEIYVLRWTAYRNNLYRIPYGGLHEAGMQAMQGWVIERAPFRGNGFAPSEGRDVIAEFKVDSVRLPHGSQLWRFDTAGHELLVAVLDADGPRWRQVGEP
jgi:SseB protein N-terminal domain